MTRNLAVLQAPRSVDQLPGCAGCGAACCQNILIPLASEEAAVLEEGNTVLSAYRTEDGGFVKLADGRRLFKMIGICGYLATTAAGDTMCTIHDDPKRPSICKEFPEGGYQCRLVQRYADVITGEEFRAYDQET